MLILRIKRCETALANGRLDEATELLRDADLRAHHRGQGLIDRLVPALIERCRQHLAAGRIAPATQDCRNAERLAGNSTEIAQLRFAIDRATTDEREAIIRRDRAAATARRLVEQGQLTLGRDFAARTDAGAIVADIDDRRSLFDRTLADANAAVDRQDWELAVKHLARAKSLCPGSGDVHLLIDTIGRNVSAEADRLIIAGQPDAAGQLLRRIESLCGSHLEVDRIRRGLDQCRAAWELLASGRHREASEILGRVANLWPAANWLRAAAMGLYRADGAIGEVRSGPLRSFAMDETMAMPRRIPSPVRPAAMPLNTPSGRFLLHVDGSGSYLVLQGKSISIGPLSASTPPDVPLMTSSNAPRISLSRSDEDYFLSSRIPVPINEKPAASKLLSAGDRIALGPRCRIDFQRPNPASSSAILHISGARLPWGGVRDVLLMDRELVIGPIASAHIKTRGEGEKIVIQINEGRLFCRASGSISIDGKPAGNLAELKPGAQVVAGGIGIAMQEIQ